MLAGEQGEVPRGGADLQDGHAEGDVQDLLA